MTWLISSFELLRMQMMDGTIYAMHYRLRLALDPYHTGSSVSHGGDGQILMSIPVTAFLYRIVFQIDTSNLTSL